MNKVFIGIKLTHPKYLSYLANGREKTLVQRARTHHALLEIRAHSSISQLVVCQLVIVIKNIKLPVFNIKNKCKASACRVLFRVLSITRLSHKYTVALS